MKKIILFPLSLSCVLILSSCLQYSFKPGATATPNVSPMLVSTLQSYATPVSVREYPGQVSDGKLLFYTEEVENICHDISDPIEIRLIFSNLSNQTINLINEFSIATNRQGEGGTIAPLLTRTNGEDVYTIADARIADYFPAPVIDFISIPAGQDFVLVTKYKFPKYFVESITSETEIILTPMPGKYFLKFVYSQYQRGVNTWHGIVGSNQMEVCILY